MRFFRRRQYIDAHKVLFTTPTVSAEFPPEGERSPRDAQVLSVSEDEWRQIEFVSRAFRTTVDAELADIRRIIEQERVDGELVGYKSCHGRSHLPRPLISTITLDGLRAHFQAIHMLDGMETAHNQVLIENTAALLLAENIVLYAHHDAAKEILILGFMGSGSTEVANELAPRFGRLMQNYDLDLVDWRSAKRISWVQEEIAALIARQA